ncbi:MAG: flavin reductase [Calditrichaeota bacterium]|nr:MAG: flavin reductase [Calditrichota bacterium]
MTQRNYNYSKHLVHPVTLISVSDGKNENVATMSWVCSVSSNPPLLMVAISPNRYSHDLVLGAGEFAILVLSIHHLELATLAGTKSGKTTIKWDLPQFKKVRKEAQFIKAPLLTGCRAALECRLVDHHAAGDHTIFIGEIVGSDYNPDVQPLILFNRRYFEPGQFIADYP